MYRMKLNSNNDNFPKQDDPFVLYNGYSTFTVSYELSL